VTIYERPTKSLMTDWAKATLKQGQTFTKDDAVRWFAQHYPKIKGSTVHVHVDVMSINSASRKHHSSIKAGSGHDLFYKLGPDEFRLRDQDTDPGPRYKKDFEEQATDNGENSPTDDAPEATAMGSVANQQSNIDLLIEAFPRYLQAFERDPPFRRYGQWEYHIETIQRRRELGSAIKAIYDDQFLAALYKTLQAWGIGIWGSKLRSFDEFMAALRDRSSEIHALEDKAIDDPQMNVIETCQQLWRLIDTLDIVANNTRIVAGSKALHHLLPELIVPMDRAYTQKFFCWQSPTFQYEQKSCFEQAFASFGQIARRTNPGQYVSSGWHSSRTKVIDNALIGLISDQQAAAEHSGIDKAQKTIVYNLSVITPSAIIQPSKPPPTSLIASIMRWCLGLVSGRQKLKQ
jgi:hypothetical protein